MTRALIIEVILVNFEEQNGMLICFPFNNAIAIIVMKINYKINNILIDSNSSINIIFKLLQC